MCVPFHRVTHVDHFKDLHQAEFDPKTQHVLIFVVPCGVIKHHVQHLRQLTMSIIDIRQASGNDIHVSATVLFDVWVWKSKLKTKMMGPYHLAMHCWPDYLLKALAVDQSSRYLVFRLIKAIRSKQENWVLLAAQRCSTQHQLPGLRRLSMPRCISLTVPPVSEQVSCIIFQALSSQDGW